MVVLLGLREVKGKGFFLVKGYSKEQRVFCSAFERKKNYFLNCEVSDTDLGTTSPQKLANEVREPKAYTLVLSLVCLDVGLVIWLITN